MTEFQELVKDAPKFASMERGELVAYAYAMYATGQKMEADNDRLRERIDDAHMSRLLTENENESLRGLCKAWHNFAYGLFDEYIGEPEASDDFMELDDRMRELGVEVGR